MTPDVKREVYRKLLHMSMGLFALSLRWLTPWQAALCALAALLHNLYLFPFYGYKKLLRPEEKARGYSGMIGYPAVVLVLILLSMKPFHGMGIGISPWDASWYREYLAVVAAAWAILAFGDASAGLVGMFLKGPALPWNPRKRWTGMAAFALVGGSFGAIWYHWVDSYFPWNFSEAWVPYLVAAAVAGLVETLPGQLDDNLTVPLAAWFVIEFLNYGYLGKWAYDFWDASGSEYTLRAIGALALSTAILAVAWYSRRRGGIVGSVVIITALVALLLWVPLGGQIVFHGLNILLGVSAWRMRLVDWPSCLLGVLFGATILFGAGPWGYAFLLLFYLISQGLTFYGRRAKESRGIAEERGGGRGIGSVFSKGFVPAFFALTSPVSFVTCLAFYAADTASSEIGKATRSNSAWLIWSRKRVAAGTVGAISWIGSLAGLLVILLFVATAWVVAPMVPGLFWDDAALTAVTDYQYLPIPSAEFNMLMICCLLACITTFFLESVLNETVVSRGYFSKEIGHLFLGGFAGALAHGLVLVYYGAYYAWFANFGWYWGASSP